MVAKHSVNISDEEKAEEYKAILEVFDKLLDSITNDMDQWEVLEELSSLRAEFAIRHAIRGFGMEYDMALELARNYDGELTGEEKAQREIIVAAFDNLVDFAVAQEYQIGRASCRERVYVLL